MDSIVLVLPTKQGSVIAKWQSRQNAAMKALAHWRAKQLDYRPGTKAYQRIGWRLEHLAERGQHLEIIMRELNLKREQGERTVKFKNIYLNRNFKAEWHEAKLDASPNSEKLRKFDQQAKKLRRWIEEAEADIQAVEALPELIA